MHAFLNHSGLSNECLINADAFHANSGRGIEQLPTDSKVVICDGAFLDEG